MTMNPLKKCAAKYFAMLVKADSKVLGVETKFVSQMLDDCEPKTRNAMLVAYHRVLESGINQKHKQSILQTISEFDRDDKLYILGHLWRLAVCDGELHSEEEKLIYEFVDAVKISRKTAIETQAQITSEAM